MSGDQSCRDQHNPGLGKDSPGRGVPATDVTSGLTEVPRAARSEARDQLLPQYQSALDELAYDAATKVNQVNAQGLDGNGAAGQAIFDLSGECERCRKSDCDGHDRSAGDCRGRSGRRLAGEQQCPSAGRSGQWNGCRRTDALGLSDGSAGTDWKRGIRSFFRQHGAAGDVVAADELQRNALSGVSLDEEAANLTKYQRAYEAAAKIFSITDELMASALNLGVTTAFS